MYENALITLEQTDLFEGEVFPEDLTERELKAFKKLVQLCKNIADANSDFLDD